MARIGEGQGFTSSVFKKAIYAIRGNNHQTKGMACAVAIEGQNEGSVLLVTDTWKGPEPIMQCRLLRYSRKHFEDYQLKPSRITQRGHFSSVLCDRKDSGFNIKSLHKKCLNVQQLKRDFRVYTIYRGKCIDLELKYSNGSYNLIDKNLSDLTLRGSPIIDEDNSEKYLVGVLTVNIEGKAIPRFLSNGILEQPAFTTHPKNPEIFREGGSITFSSDANGIPEPTFSWTKDGSEVTADDRISLSADNKQLSLTNVNRTDSGEYRCVATNSVRTVYSDAATLTVHYQPEFTAHPQSKTLVQGSSVALSSDANGVPEPTFSWTKDGSAVTADNRISLSGDNKTLSITNVNRTDSGEYRCVAANSVGTVNSNAAMLTVHYQPEFTKHPQSQTLVQGSSVTLSSDANGVPEPTFTWTKDGSAVIANKRISLSADNKQLSLTNMNSTDTGEYRCVATNSVRTVYSNAATLTLQGAPGQQQGGFEFTASSSTSTHDGRSEYKVSFKVTGNRLIDGIAKISDVVMKVLAVVLVDQVACYIRNVEPFNSILVELGCYTTKSFVSLVEDLEKGRVKRRLEEEFENVGCKGELEISITNAEEVHEALDEIRLKRTGFRFFTCCTRSRGYADNP